MAESSKDIVSAQRAAQIFVDVQHGAMLERSKIVKPRKMDWVHITQSVLTDNSVVLDRLTADNASVDESPLAVHALKVTEGIMANSLKYQKAASLIGDLLTDDVKQHGDLLLHAMSDADLEIPEPDQRLTQLPETKEVLYGA